MVMTNTILSHQGLRVMMARKMELRVIRMNNGPVTNGLTGGTVPTIGLGGTGVTMSGLLVETAMSRGLKRRR